MNFSDLILLNFLARIRISATINPQKVEVSDIIRITENYVELRNIFRVKRDGDITNLCSDKTCVKLTYPCLQQKHDGVG